ncbi:MAG: hypothetical protein EZS28_046669, partial [Streblomastix strix]
KFPTKISDFIKKQKEDALVFIEEEGLFEYYDDDCFEEAFYKIFMTEEGKQLEEELFNNIIALDLDETEKGMDSNEDYNVILFDNKLDSEIRTNDAQIFDKEKYCKEPMRPDSAVIIGDYKENIKLDRKREEEGKKWFEKVPVSVLTFVA